MKQVLPKTHTCFRAAKPAENENLTVFIRSDEHVVRAGLKIKGLRPLDNPQGNTFLPN